MNHAIHPDYTNCTITCSCGVSFASRSTVGDIKVEICGACHPFYTGRQKFVDTAGRIQRFQEKYQWKGDAVTAASKKKKAAPGGKPAGAADDDF